MSNLGEDWGGRMNGSRRRRGAGRKVGTSPRNYRKTDYKHYRETYPVWPLDHMLAVLNAPNVPEKLENGEPNPAYVSAERRDEAARSAAPYLHPKLHAMDINARRETVEYAVDLAKLTDEELVALRRMMAKSQSPALIDATAEEIAEDDGVVDEDGGGGPGEDEAGD